MNDERPLEEIRERLERTEEQVEELVKELKGQQKELEDAGMLPGVPPVPRDFNNVATQDRRR
jgi:hypothetical protein